MGRSTRKQRATRQLLLIVVAIVLAILAATRHDPLTALWSGLAAIASTGWLILDKLPTRCGMPTKLGRPCRRDTAGVLFGCKDHTWEKFFSWFGWHRREPVETYSEPSDLKAEPGRGLKAFEGSRNKRYSIMVRLTAAASCAAIVSMITDLIGLFD